MQNIQIQNINSSELEQIIYKVFINALKDSNIVLSVASPTTPVEKKLLSKKEAAAYLKISLPTLSKYINGGFVKAHTVTGTRMRFKISDLDKSLRGLRNR